MNIDRRVLVLVDRHRDDCSALKLKLEKIARGARLSTRGAPDGAGRFRLVNRIVVPELEAWLLGDPEAVHRTFTGLKGRFPSDPDTIDSAARTLHGMLKAAGHHLGKIDVAGRIGAHLEPGRNRSTSFQAFRTALAELAAGEAHPQPARRR